MSAARPWLRGHAAALVIGASLATVAVVTGFISYTHICALTLVLSQSWKTAHLMPLAVDGQIIIGSAVFMVLSGPNRWWGLLGVVPGLAESLFANWESGISHGLLAAAWATVAAQAFAVSSFLFERWLKSQASQPENLSQPVTSFPVAPEAVPAVPGAYLNGSGLHPAEVQPFADELARGEVPTIRRIRDELHVGQPKAQEIRARLSALARTP